MRAFIRSLASLDERFRWIHHKYAHQMQCGRGCAQCCHGLFDVSLPEAYWITQAFRKLPAERQADVTKRAFWLHGPLLQAIPDLPYPYFLDDSRQAALDLFLDGIPDARCPFLNEQDHCLIYTCRPAACRLEGLPMADAQDGVFDDWCSRNFTMSLSPEMVNDLQLDYYALQALERSASEEIARLLPGRYPADCTVLIPSVLVAMEDFWKHANKFWTAVPKE